MTEAINPHDLGVAGGYIIEDMMQRQNDRLKAENAQLRELVRGLRMAYVGALNECESKDEGLTWEVSCSGDIEGDLAKMHARYEANRHRFDVAMRELGIEVDG